MGRGERVFAMLLASTLWACATDRPDDDVFREPLPNGGTRVIGPAHGLWSERTRWTLNERFRVGAVDGSGPEVFGSVWDIEIDSSERLYVLDRTSREVRVFGPAGTFVSGMGQEGEGPGEFRNPFGLTWGPSGNLWVVDVDQSRYSVFSPEGEHLGEFRRSVGGFSWPWPGRFADDGRLYEPSFARNEASLLAFELADQLTAADSFPLSLPEETGFWDLRDERGVGYMVQIPFAGQSEWALDHEATVWVGKSDVYSLARRHLEGDTILVIERQVAPVPISSAEVVSATADLTEHANHPRFDLSRIPESKPFFRRVIPDERGALWLLREGEGERWFFDVFQQDGVYLGPVELPVSPELIPPPVVRHGLVAVATTDDMGVPYVVVYEVHRPAG